MILATLVLCVTPLLFLPSPIGVIEVTFPDPEGFLERGHGGRYAYLLMAQFASFASVAVQIGVEPPWLAPVPAVPWIHFFIALWQGITYAGAIWLLGGAFKRVGSNARKVWNARTM